MRIELPEKVKTILNILINAGFEAFAVGGCVRDSILGKEPKDWDITTSARPVQVKELFSRTIDTGIAHGTVTVLLDREGFEVTTYRIDGEYEDARHPKEVLFTGSLLEDLKRRDFTINAMAYNEQEGLVDAFDGMGDLKQGRIRCVGTARERFTEDALRMLRAVRFAAQLGFSIEPETRRGIEELACSLQKISAERIQAELVKLLVSDHPEEVRTLYETGISKEIFPWLDAMFRTPQNNPHHIYNVGEHTVCALMYTPPDKILRLALFFHDMAKPACLEKDEEGIYHFRGHPKEGAAMTRLVMRRLKFDNDTIDRVASLVQWHDDNPPLTPANVRRAINRIGQRQFPRLFAVKRADTMGKGTYQREEKLAYIDKYETMYREILEKEECIHLKTLAVSGKDLIAAGFKPGRELGRLLEELLQLVLENPECNTKEFLLEKAAERE